MPFYQATISHKLEYGSLLDILLMEFMMIYGALLIFLKLCDSGLVLDLLTLFNIPFLNKKVDSLSVA